MWKSKLTYQQKYDFMRENWIQCISWMRFEAFEVYDYKTNPWLAVLVNAVIGTWSLAHCSSLYLYDGGDNGSGWLARVRNRYNVPCRLPFDVLWHSHDFEQPEISEISDGVFGQGATPGKPDQSTTSDISGAQHPNQQYCGCSE
ncbi:unnamed protein product [Caenorhabditis brenneri]